jgi:CRISPR/Cas system-associated exonuclease Cas4 (RecB family)/rubrerythrin
MTMTDNTLKTLKSTYKRSDVLLPSIERHVLKKAKEPSDRRSDIMHPSEMAKGDWCGRHDYYRIIDEPKNYKGRSPSFRLENVFDYGHSVHAKYQRWLQEMGVMWGKWYCKECGNTWLGDTPTSCDRCAGTDIKYNEVPFVSEEMMIAGHSDGIVNMDGVYKMIEIKTVGMGTLRFDAYSLFDKYQKENLTLDELWWNIKRPFASHVRQGQIYLHLTQMLYPELGVDEIIFIYEWKPTQEVKEFSVKYNPDLISGILDTAELVAESVRNGEPPTPPEWAVKDGKKCSSCEYRNTCWGEDDDSTQSEAAKPAIRIKRSTTAKRGRAIRS